MASRFPPPSPRSGDAVRVLIVEGAFDSGELLEMSLSSKGYDVRLASRAEAALAIVAGFSPDFAFVDLGLPGVDAEDLIAVIRARPHLADCRCISLSRASDSQLQGLSDDAGFERTLTKPLVLADVLAILESPGATTVKH